MTALRLRLVARVGPTSSTLSPYVTFSLAAHVVFVAVLVLLPAFTTRHRAISDPLVVDLVAMPRPAAKTQPPAPPAKSEPQPSAVPRLETREPPKPKPLPEKPEPARDRPAEPPPREPLTAPPAPAPGEAGPEPADDAGASITALEGGDVEFSWYRASVTAALYTQWRRPILEGFGEPIEVAVAFEILQDGSVVGLRVESPSGVPSLDRSALRAVTDAVPLPPLPATWRSPTLPARYIFRLHPE